MPNMVFLIAVILLILTSTIKVLREWERGVILRLGKFQSVRGPGIIIVIPLIERMFRINTRLVTVDVPPQDIITKDNVTMNVNAVVFFRVLSPREAVVNVENFYDATFLDFLVARDRGEPLVLGRRLHGGLSHPGPQLAVGYQAIHRGRELLRVAGGD
jgi:regulator of protease activity HflC (stomatin/prohibitin superfamily)